MTVVINICGIGWVLLTSATSGFSGLSILLLWRWGESGVGIGWVLLASATSRIIGYIKLAYCSSMKGLWKLSGTSI